MFPSSAENLVHGVTFVDVQKASAFVDELAAHPDREAAQEIINRFIRERRNEVTGLVKAIVNYAPVDIGQHLTRHEVIMALCGQPLEVREPAQVVGEQLQPAMVA
jgi:hypothetical protein